MTENNNMSESECYNRIIKFFHSDINDKEKVEKWKSQSYIKLMNSLESKEDKELAQNAIIMILSLFENIPPDIYNNRGFKLKNLDTEEREKIISKLKEEAS
jgi:hypothetical protein